MKITNKMALFIVVTFYALSPGLTVYAEPDTPRENKARMSLLGWTHLEGDRGFHLAFDGSVPMVRLAGIYKLPSGEHHFQPATNDQHSKPQL